MAPAVFYIAVTLVFTHPLAFRMAPLAIFDANIFHPEPRTLAYSEHQIGSALIAAPLIWGTGNLVLAMNAVLLLSCFLSGWFAYALGRQLGLSTTSAILVGATFALSPPRPGSWPISGSLASFGRRARAGGTAPPRSRSRSRSTSLFSSPICRFARSWGSSAASTRPSLGPPTLRATSRLRPTSTERSLLLSAWEKRRPISFPDSSLSRSRCWPFSRGGKPHHAPYMEMRRRARRCELWTSPSSFFLSRRFSSKPRADSGG